MCLAPKLTGLAKNELDCPKRTVSPGQYWFTVVTTSFLPERFPPMRKQRSCDSSWTREPTQMYRTQRIRHLSIMHNKMRKQRSCDVKRTYRQCWSVFYKGHLCYIFLLPQFPKTYHGPMSFSVKRESCKNTWKLIWCHLNWPLASLRPSKSRSKCEDALCANRSLPFY